jgi:hypothetical protein
MLLLAAMRVEAQPGYRFVPRAQAEVRVETVLATSPTALAGIGVNVPAGYLVRMGPNVAAGRVFGDSAANTARAEFVARFLTDPFHERRWGAYGGAGVGITWTEGRRARASLVLKVGADFPGRAGWRPALELALGGGVRAGLVLRSVRRTGR